MNTPPSSLEHMIRSLPGFDANDLPVAKAQQIIRGMIKPIEAMEKVTLRSALGRILATDIATSINVPADDNSAMDGYALHGADLRSDAPSTLRIVGTAYAGRPFTGEVERSECIAIMTGAIMPDNCDSVVPQELTCDVTQSHVTIPAGAIKPGANRRLKGEDLRIGQAALSRGKILRPADLGLLASLGISEVPVQRRLRVAFFSTGDELRSVGEPLDPGCVYDSNRYTLHGMLTRLGCEVIDLGVVGDDPAALETAFRTACETADAILTSGGVSVGAADYTKQIMAQLGEVAFWKIAMRPGRPLAFGHIESNGHRACLFGLPGNPVAVMVSFYFFARDALLHMMGAQSASLPLMRVPSECAIRKKPGRTEYQRGIVSRNDDGRQTVKTTGAQGSGILRSMSEANCMVVLAHEQGDVNPGDDVDIILFDGLI